MLIKIKQGRLYVFAFLTWDEHYKLHFLFQFIGIAHPQIRIFIRSATVKGVNLST